MTKCKNCKVHGVRNDEDGAICCPSCGKVLEFNNFIDEPAFEKGPQGQSRLAGSYIKSVESCYTDSYENTIRRGSQEIEYMGQRLGIGMDVIGEATRYHKLALSVDFTKGRLGSLVTASCLYIACRMNKKPYLLIDFAQDLGVSVYMVGDVFLKLCKKLRLDEQTYFAIDLVDPVLFIPRFMECIVKDRHIGQQQKVDMRKTAERILASMKRDWMQTGRKPSGLCGAALYISAISIGLKCTKSDIAGVVHMCEDTLTKRLIEFEETESGSMTIYELNKKDDEKKKLEMLKPTSGDTEAELLCKHKSVQLGIRPPNFANGLCETCYREFIEVSGGCQGGSDPPAFQRSERIRMEKLSELRNLPGRQGSESTVNGHQGNVEMSDVREDESENLSDIDDVEVDEYLHDEEETRLKTKLWETLNKEYMEEEAAKEKAAKDREAYEAKFQNGGSVDLLGAKEFAEAAAANVAKSRKELRQKRAAEVKNAGPAHTAAEAARRMLTRKRLHSKINYDLLDKLFESSKGKDIETDSKDFSDIRQHKKGKIEHESDVVYNEDDYNDFRQEDEFEKEENAGAMHGDDFYQEYQEDENYGFEDYGNEGYDGY